MLFLFLDGVGLGDADSELNPLTRARTPVLAELIGGPMTRERRAVTRPGLTFRALDATLGVEGLPQSATGQTTLLTGANGAARMNRHYGPWPGPTLMELLNAGTLFHDAARLDGAVLANAYPDAYFATIDTRRFRPNAPVVAARSAGVELRDMRRYNADEAVAVDLTGQRFAQQEPGAEPQPPELAAEVLARLALGASLTFFDLWLTDALGHARNGDEGVKLLERLDALLGHLLTAGAGAAFTLVMTSDHGNLEDLSTRGHTMNDVPLLVLGKGAERFTEARSLVDVAPAIRRVWGSAAQDEDDGLVPGAHE